MKEYELAVLLHPDLEIDLDAPLARIDDTLKSVKAELLKRDEWGKRKLAYKIKGQAFALYLFYVVKVDPAKTSELEEALRLNDEVLRHMLVEYVPPVQNESTQGDDDSEGDKPDDESKSTKKAKEKS